MRPEPLSVRAMRREAAQRAAALESIRVRLVMLSWRVQAQRERLDRLHLLIRLAKP